MTASAPGAPAPTSVLISGASIAGPALALWLQRSGCEVTLVEKSPGIRTGGQPVDFKGSTHLTVLERMGVLDEVRAASVTTADGALVDRAGRRIGTVPGALAGGDLNVPRGDLARILHDRTAGECTYLFGDHATALSQDAEGVDVTFAHAARRRFDLVVGADGIHSGIRRLAFGPEEDHVTHLGHCYAQFSAGSSPGLDQDEMYNEPGRMASTSAGQDPALLVFASEPPAHDRDDTAAQKRLLAAAYDGAGWKVPQLLEALDQADDLWMDSISRVTVERWSTGRVVLLGDSAWGNALGGFGTGLAVVGAYVLAAELGRAGGDHRAAFEAYEARFRPYARVSRKVDAGRLLAPRTRLGIRLRNSVFSLAPLFGPLMALSDRFATDIELPDPAGHVAAAPEG